MPEVRLMKKQKSNPIAALGAVVTLIVLELSIRRVMKKYGQKA